MAKCECIANTDFVHDDIDARAGQIVKHKNGMLIEESLARDLERNGLVRIRLNERVEGKESDDGQGQPSSVSQAAPVSPMTTCEPLKRGRGRPRKVTVEPSS